MKSNRRFKKRLSKTLQSRGLPLSKPVDRRNNVSANDPEVTPSAFGIELSIACYLSMIHHSTRRSWSTLALENNAIPVWIARKHSHW